MLPYRSSGSSGASWVAHEVVDLAGEIALDADEVFTMASEVVAVDGDTGVAQVEVRYGDPGVQHYRDLGRRPRLQPGALP
jgi:hypothetical protein